MSAWGNIAICHRNDDRLCSRVSVSVWFSLFVCLTEGDAACQRCVLGSEERELGFASAVVEQRPSGCRLQRRSTSFILHECSSDGRAYDNTLCVYSQYGTSALMVASYSGHYECVRELIMQGADVNLQREVRGS